MKEKGYITVTAEQIKKRDKRIKIIYRYLIIVVLIFLFLLGVLTLVYQGGDFVITLDPQFSLKSGLRMYDNEELKHSKIKLYANGMEFMDNISGNWIPKDINKKGGGSHNGENYIAYNFFLENTGERIIDYWYQIEIVDVIKRVDEALRIKIIRNEEEIVYAKLNNQTKKAEKETTSFYSDKYAVLKQREKMKPKEMDKYTIIMWIEGDDPDCLDDLIGGELKLKLRITESHIDEKEKIKKK